MYETIIPAKGTITAKRLEDLGYRLLCKYSAPMSNTNYAGRLDIFYTSIFENPDLEPWYSATMIQNGRAIFTSSTGACKICSTIEELEETFCIHIEHRENEQANVLGIADRDSMNRLMNQLSGGNWNCKVE